MIASERKKIIIDEIEAKGSVSIEDLCQITAASVSTLRRDLTDLEEQGRLNRVHGGAEEVTDLSLEAGILEKESKNVKEKQEIAKKAVNFLNDGDVIFIDAGSTTAFFVAEILTKNLSLTIVTNSVTHASKLQGDKLSVYVLGGAIKRLTDAVVGSQAQRQLMTFNFTKAFLGANAISERGISTPDLEEAKIKEEAKKHALETYILADSSKFNHNSFVKFADIDQVNLISDKEY